MSRIPRPSIEKIEKRLTLFTYGPPNSGKTWTAIHFPNAYIIDIEKGAVHDNYVDIIRDKKSILYHSQTYDEILNVVKALLAEKHEFKTIVIDSLSKLYNLLLAEGEQVLAGTRSENKFAAEYQYANKKIKRLLALLFRLDMNVICTGHVKELYDSSANKMVSLGKTFECTRNIDHEFDLCIQTKKEGSDYRGSIRKSRLEGFKADSDIPFSYDYIVNTYGKEAIEKESEHEPLASKEQVIECERLVKALQIPQELTIKWLNKANADNFGEMRAIDIEKCINYMMKMISPDEEEKQPVLGCSTVIPLIEVTASRDSDFYKRYMLITHDKSLNQKQLDEKVKALDKEYTLSDEYKTYEGE